VTERHKRLHIGRVVVQTIQMIGDNIVLLAPLSVIIAVPSLIVRYQQSFFADPGLYYSAPYLLAVSAYIVSVFLLTAAIATIVIRNRFGHSVSLKEGLADVAGDIYPLAVIAFITSFTLLVTVIASPDYPIILILAIPGFYIQLVSWVVVPVRTIERAQLLATFARSFELTRGNRWPLLALLVAATTLTLGLEVLSYGALGDPAAAESESSRRAALFALVCGDVINGIISAAMAVALYFELRLIKEGVAPEDVAAEFD
jgi:hypothetical protein